MTPTEKRSAEFESFDSFFAGLSMRKEKNAMIFYERYIQAFLATSIAQAIGEDRERVVKGLLKEYKGQESQIQDAANYISSLDKLTDEE